MLNTAASLRLRSSWDVETTNTVVALRTLARPAQAMLEEVRELQQELVAIEGGAPHDEYDPEVGDLLKWRRPVTVDQVVDVFRRRIGMPISQVDAQTPHSGHRADSGNVRLPN